MSSHFSDERRENYSRDQLQRSLLDVVAAMKEYTVASMTQICGCAFEDSCEFVGSGTIVLLRGRPYLLTAHHVVEQLRATTLSGERKYPFGSCHSLGHGELMLATAPRWYARASPLDIAISAVNQNELSKSTMVQLDAARFETNTNVVDDDLYFVSGWPGSASRFVVQIGPGVFSRSQPYGGWLSAATSWPLFDTAMHLAICAWST
jgi:hypothetical protein